MKHRRQARIDPASMNIGSCLSFVGALALTAVIGNLRGEDSGTVGSERDRDFPAVRAGRSAQVLPVGSEEEGQLIPAVYAWDPAVRFVYDRHVSKWM